VFARLIAKLEHDQYLETQCSTPGGRVLEGEDRARDEGYRKGWNDCARAIVGLLKVEQGLAELKARAPMHPAEFDLTETD